MSHNSTMPLKASLMDTKLTLLTINKKRGGEQTCFFANSLLYSMGENNFLDYSPSRSFTWLCHLPYLPDFKLLSSHSHQFWSTVLTSHCYDKTPRKTALKGENWFVLSFSLRPFDSPISTSTSGKTGDGGANMMAVRKGRKRMQKRKGEQNIVQRAGFLHLRPTKSLPKHRPERDLALGPAFTQLLKESSDPKH